MAGNACISQSSVRLVHLIGWLVALTEQQPDGAKFLSSTFPGYFLAGCKGVLSMADSLGGEAGDSHPEVAVKVVVSLSDPAVIA